MAELPLTYDEYCPKREDNQHCNCWYDGGKCCGCGAPEMSNEQKVAQGMIESSSERDGQMETQQAKSRRSHTDIDAETLRGFYLDRIEGGMSHKDALQDARDEFIKVAPSGFPLHGRVKRAKPLSLSAAADWVSGRIGPRRIGPNLMPDADRQASSSKTMAHERIDRLCCHIQAVEAWATQIGNELGVPFSPPVLTEVETEESSLNGTGNSDGLV